MPLYTPTSGGGEITESHFRIINNGAVAALEIPNYDGSGNRPFAQLGSVGYYGTDYADSYVEDVNQVITVVGDDFTVNNIEYDDETYGALYLPTDVGGLVTMSAVLGINDVATESAAISPAMYAAFEVYSLPTFVTVQTSSFLRAPEGSPALDSGGMFTWTQWMMPDPGDQLWFGLWIQNNHPTMDVRVFYDFRVTLLQRKEA